MKKVAYIINPFSAKGNYQPFLKELKKTVSEPLYHISQSFESTNSFIKKHFDEVEIFVAIGGDGTISSVAKNIVHTDKILAIYPEGSGNGFSNEMHFSNNFQELLSKIERKQFHSIDAFMVNDHISINVSGVGFDGKVVRDFEKTNRGIFNYIKTSIITFFRYKPVYIDFLNSQYKTFNGEYLMLNIANTRQFGNNAYIAPHADKSDGLLELVLVKKFPIWYSAIFTFKLFTKRLTSDNYVEYLSVPSIKFSTNSTHWHIDGEYQQIPSPISVKVLPKSLRVLY